MRRDFEDSITCCQDILDRCDAKQPTFFEDIPVLSTRPIGGNNQRVDGKEGNILCTVDRLGRKPPGVYT